MKDSICQRSFSCSTERNSEKEAKQIWAHQPTIGRRRIKFSVYGEEMRVKKVGWSGKSGRVYVPLDWLGKRVKIVRVD